MSLPPRSLLLLAVIGCGGPEAPPRAEATDAESFPADTALISAAGVRVAGFSTAPVTLVAWRDAWSAPARLILDPAATELIGSIVEGRVVRVYASPGDRVRPGDVLVAIHAHEMMDARAGLSSARAGMARAESEFRVAASASDRAERLHAIKALSLADLERARGSRVDAEAMRDAARGELTRAEAFLHHLLGDGALPTSYDEHWVLIRAPIAGQVISRSVQPGQVVLVGAPLLTVSRTSALTLVLQLPDDAVRGARVGAPVRFSVSAHPTRSFDATVTRVFPAVDTVTRTVEVHAAVADPRGLLKAEMFASAELFGAATAPVATVPIGAVQSFEGDTVVIEAQQRGEGLRLEALPVRVGRRTRERAEIVAGIDTGRVVVVGGAAVAKAEILRRRGGG